MKEAKSQPSTVATRHVNLTFVEGETYFHPFSELLFGTDNEAIEVNSSIPDSIAVNNTGIQSLEFRELLATELQVTVSNQISSVSFSTENFGSDVLAHMIYQRKQTANLTSGHTHILVETRVMEYVSSELALSTHNLTLKKTILVDLAQVSIPTLKCKLPQVIHQFKKVVMTCLSTTGGQILFIQVCSDKSCHERSDPLKIQEKAKDIDFGLLRTRRLPGISDQSFTLLLWYEDLPHLEVAVVDSTGQLSSEVYQLEFPIRQIRYFSGQLLMIDSLIQGKMQYFFAITDFGTKKLDMETIKFRTMKGFGTFVNSYNNPLNNQMMIEVLEGKSLIDLAMQRTTEEFFIEHSKQLFRKEEKVVPSKQLVIFEMSGEFQLMLVRSDDLSKISQFKIINRYEVHNFQGHNTFSILNTSFNSIPGMNKLISGHLETTATNSSIFKILEVDFNEPYLELNTTRIVEKQLSVMPTLGIDVPINLTVNLTQRPYLPEKRPYETLNIQIIRKQQYQLGKKFKTSPNTTMTKSLMGVNSDYFMPLKDVVTGNFMCLKAMHLKDGTSIQFSSRLNPLLKYDTIWTDLKIRTNVRDFELSSDLFSITTENNQRFSFDVMTYNSTQQSVKIFRTARRGIELRKTEFTKIGFKYAELFNKSTALVHSPLGLYRYDVESENLKELIFDSGKCLEVLMVKHSSLDATVWCFGEHSKISVFYAQDILEGKEGVRRIPIVVEDFSGNFSNKIFKYNDYFPDSIFMIDHEGKLTIFKVEAKFTIVFKEVKTMALVEYERGSTTVYDFEMINQYLMVYSVKKIGFSDRIILDFYFIWDAITVRKTKQIDLLYYFTRDPLHTQIYKFMNIRKHGSVGSKFASTPYLLLPVKYQGVYQNVLFIDPRTQLAQTIPFTLLPMASTVTTLKLGKSLFTNSENLKYGMIVYYNFIDKKGERFSLMKIDETDPILKLTTDLDGNYYYSQEFTKESVVAPTAIEFEPDFTLKEQSGLMFNFSYVSVDGSRLVTNGGLAKFSNQSIRIEMEKLDSESDNSNGVGPNRSLYYIQDTKNLTVGDVANWSITHESTLEEISGTFTFGSHIRNITRYEPGQYSTSLFLGQSTRDNCTKVHKSFMSVSLNNQTNQTLVEAYVCMGQILNFTFRLMVEPMPIVLLYETPSKLVSSNSDVIYLSISGKMLEMTTTKTPDGRKMFSDFYFIDITQNPQTLAYKLTLHELTRKFFSESLKDFMVQETSYDNVTKTTNFDYFDWSIIRSHPEFYNITFDVENWRVVHNTSTGVYSLAITDPCQYKMNLNQKLYNNSLIELYDDFTFSIMNKHDTKYLWLLLENPVYEAYILRYRRAGLVDNRPAQSGRIDMVPDVWRLSNPMYGYELIVNTKIQKSDWLLTMVKQVSGGAGFLLVYIVPSSAFEENPTRVNTIYVKDSITISSGSLFKVEPSQTLDPISLRELITANRTTFKWIQTLSRNQRITRAQIYPWLQLRTDNLYHASRYLNLTVTGFKKNTDTKQMDIIPAESDSWLGKFPLLIYLSVVFGIGAAASLFLYKGIEFQNSRKGNSRLYNKGDVGSVSNVEVTANTGENNSGSSPLLEFRQPERPANELTRQSQEEERF